MATQPRYHPPASKSPLILSSPGNKRAPHGRLKPQQGIRTRTFRGNDPHTEGPSGSGRYLFSTATYNGFTIKAHVHRSVSPYIRPFGKNDLETSLFSRPLFPYFSKRSFSIQRRYKFFIFNKFFILHGSATSEAQTAPISPKVKNFVPNQGIYNLLPVAIMEEAI